MVTVSRYERVSLTRYGGLQNWFVLFRQEDWRREQDGFTTWNQVTFVKQMPEAGSNLRLMKVTTRLVDGVLRKQDFNAGQLPE